MKRLLIAISLLCASCTTDHPVTYGTLGGAAAGVGIGALVGKASPIVSAPQGMAIGAGVGIPTGILLAYASDETAKYYILSSNNEAIASNYETILDNQYSIEELRNEVAFEAPRGNPDEDRAEYIYVGPTLGNSWR